MKFNVGDRVIVKSIDDIIDTLYDKRINSWFHSVMFTDPMKKYCGESVYIKTAEMFADYPLYRAGFEQNNTPTDTWCFREEWFEDLSEDEMSIDIESIFDEGGSE